MEGIKMAQAITRINKKVPNKAEEREQSIQQILEKVAENRETIFIALDVFKGMSDAGLLQIADGILKNRQKVGKIAITQMNQPGVHHLVKNIIQGLKFLGSLDPGQVETLLNGLKGLARGLERGMNEAGGEKAPSLWTMLKDARDPEIRASLNLFMNFLKGMGEELQSDANPVH